MINAAFLLHTATLRSKKKIWSLLYDGGTAVFTVGKTLTGATSHATSTIVSIGAAASGTLTMHSISGTFQNNDPLSDNGTIPGAANADGTVFETLDAYGQPTEANVDTTVACRLIFQMKRFGPGMPLDTVPTAIFPPGTSVAEGDQLVSTVTGFAETYGIVKVRYVYEVAANTVSHITCELGAIV